MKWRIVKNAWWMFWARGMVFFRWVWLKPQSTEQADYRLFRHELQHCYDQFQEGSKLRWYWKYLKWGFRHGFSDAKHRDEAHAEEHEVEPLTIKELHWWHSKVIRM